MLTNQFPGPSSRGNKTSWYNRLESPSGSHSPNSCISNIVLKLFKEVCLSAVAVLQLAFNLDK